VDPDSLKQQGENQIISQFFLSFFYSIFSGVEAFVDVSHTFDRDAFSASREPAIQEFLSGFAMTQIFEMFVVEIEKLHADAAMSGFALSAAEMARAESVAASQQTTNTTTSPTMAPAASQRTKTVAAQLDAISRQCGGCGANTVTGVTDLCSKCSKKSKRAGFMSMITTRRTR
jgi:hypothetical protein